MGFGRRIFTRMGDTMSKEKKSAKKPLVSIITPCFNSGKYLKECIESVLRQDYPFVEHIIQDGGSTDNTLKILNSYAGAKYKNRICWQSEPDKGQADGLNRALQRAKGDILLVLNADDVLLPNACSWGVEMMEKNPDCAVVYGDEYFIDENGEIFAIFVAKHPYSYDKLFCVELVPPAQAAFIRRSMFEKVGFYADSSLATCPDYEMWVRIGAKYPMKHEFGIVCKYRHHPQSEGRRPDMIDKMVKAKRIVMDRFLLNRRSPSQIRRLRRRAYAGLYQWAAGCARGMGCYKKEIFYLLLSIYWRPQWHKFFWLLGFLWRHGIRKPKLVISRRYHWLLHKIFTILPKSWQRRLSRTKKQAKLILWVKFKNISLRMLKFCIYIKQKVFGLS